MGKPYRLRNLISLFVLIVMLSSGFLSIVCFSFLRAFRLLPSAFFATIWMPVIVMIVANLIAAVAQLFLVPQIIKPIEKLIEATGKVAKGDFSVRISSENLGGEMKELVDSFNAMTEELGGIEIFRSDFIRDFSHEFKTPIVSMKGFAKQLKNPDLSEEERRQYCDIILSESERLSGMSENILLLSKFENQQIITGRKDYRLDEQIRDCILLLQREWEQKKLEFDLELEPVMIRHNAEMLHHVWTNLIANAIHFTPENGKIGISVHQNKDSILVAIRDTGIGMTEEQVRHAFDKCYQADPSHSGKGNGLGLCIVKRICTLSGGSVSIQSSPGEGSVFTVLLPK